MRSKNNKTKVIKLRQKVVKLECVSIHPSLNDLISNIISRTFVEGLSEESKQIIFATEKPICIENKEGTYTAISKVKGLIIVNSLASTITKIPIQIYEGNEVERFIINELIIKPMLYYHKPSDFGLAYKKIKSSDYMDNLKIFSSAFSSQASLSATLGCAKNTVFPPKQKLNSTGQENTNSCDESGEKAEISTWISTGEMKISEK